MVVGGGFGGLYAARALARHPLRVVLIDRVNYHLFQPLLYQVATAALSPGEIAEPLRAILRKNRNVEVLLGDVTAIDRQARCLKLEDGAELTYDFLVLATGARHSYFAHPEWEAVAPGLKSLADALEMRRRILLAFELAERERDQTRRQALLTFVVIGGGPTGVELAGAIAEIARHTVSRDFRNYDPRQARIILFERGERVLEQYPPDLSASAVRALERLGVEVHHRRKRNRGHRRLRSHRARSHPHAYRALGGRRAGITTWPPAGCRGGSQWSRSRSARPERCGTS